MSPRKKKARLAGATAAGRQSKPQEAFSTMTTVSDTTRKAPESATRLVGPGFAVVRSHTTTQQPSVVETTATERRTRVGFMFGDFLERKLFAVALGSHGPYVWDVASDVSKGRIPVDWELHEMLVNGEPMGERPYIAVHLVEEGAVCDEPSCDDFGSFEAFDDAEDRLHRSSFGKRCHLSKLGSDPWGLTVTENDVCGQSAMAEFADEVQRAVARANVLNQGLRWRCDTCWGSPDEGHCLECGAIARAE